MPPLLTPLTQRWPRNREILAGRDWGWGVGWEAGGEGHWRASLFFFQNFTRVWT